MRGAALVAVAVLAAAAARTAQGQYQSYSCPTSVGGGGVWPSSRLMQGETVPDAGRACCIFPWVEPTHFGTAEELQAEGLPTSGKYCVHAATLAEFKEQLGVESACIGECGPYITPESCARVSHVCDEFGPPLDTACCMAYSSSSQSGWTEAVSDFHLFPWMPVTLCSASGSPGTLFGTPLTADSSMPEPMEVTCPASPSPATQQVLITSTLDRHFAEGLHVLALHSKSVLSPTSIEFELTDASGAEMIPKTTADMSSPDERRRSLLKTSSSSGSSSNTNTNTNSGTSPGSDDDAVDYSGSLVISDEMVNTFILNSGKKFVLIEGLGYRYLNAEGYTIPFNEDVEAMQQGEPLAAIGGGGLLLWASGSDAENTTYGVPSNFNSTWYDSNIPISKTPYGYKGKSAWAPGKEIITWGQPYSCSQPGSCTFRSSQLHYPKESEQEFRSGHVDCEMSLDLFMNNAFDPATFTFPFTLTIHSISAEVGQAGSGAACDNLDSPGDSAMYVSLVQIPALDSMPRPNATEITGSWDGYLQGGSWAWRAAPSLSLLFTSAVIAFMAALAAGH